MRIAVVVNRMAGGLIGHEEIAAMLAERLAAAGLELALIIDDKEAPLVDRMRAACALNPDAVVVAGGDGSIGCAAEFLIGTPIALGILPLGTVNRLARDLGVPAQLDRAIETLATGEARSIDVGSVNGRIFVCSAMLGIPARVAVRREEFRGRPLGLATMFRLAYAAFAALRRYPPLRLAVQVGVPPLRLRTQALAVVNNAYDEGLGRVLTRSRLDRGELVLYTTRDLGAWRLIRLALRHVLGVWRSDEALGIHHVRRLALTANRSLLRVMLDGEVRLMRPPLRFRVRPRVLRVIVPRRHDAASSGALALESLA